MVQQIVRLGPAEEKLIAQLASAGAVAAAERLSGTGLPTRRVESYHYTDLKALLREVPDLSEVAHEAGAPALRIPGAYRIVIVNGDIQRAGTAPAGVIVGSSDGGALSERDDVLVRLNTALAPETLTLNLDSSVDPVLHIDHRIEGEAAHVADSVHIYVADGGSATIVETYSGSDAAHMGNHGSYVALGKGASATHIMVDLSGDKVRHFASVEYELGEDSNLRTIALNAGSALSRTQVFGRFAASGAHADFGGLNLVEDGQHCDITLDIRHDVPNTTSAETFKTVGRGRSRGVFQGKIVVAKDAQKTNAKMMANGLMLSDEAEIFAKPELEIFADDVVCGHGSTVGAPDEASLFYLMSRGIPPVEAEAMLVRAFLAEVFDGLEDAELHDALMSVADGWLRNAYGKAAA